MTETDTLHQRRLLSRRSYSLVQGGVQVEERGLLRHQKYRVPYENITPESFEVSTSSRGWFWASLIAFVMAAAMVADYFYGAEPDSSASLFYAFFGVFFLVVHLTTRETFTGFPAGGGALLFWKDRPSTTVIMAFVERMKAEQKAYLRQEYVQQLGTPVSVADEIERLAALKERGVLSDAEFERLKGTLVGGAQRGIVGFN